MGMLVYLPIPGVSLVWVPGALYLFFQSAYLKTAVPCMAGAVILFLDHVVKNLLAVGRVKLHPLLVIFSVLGGLKLFGLLGLVAGPLTVAMSMALLDVYRIGRAESSGKEGGDLRRDRSVTRSGRHRPRHGQRACTVMVTSAAGGCCSPSCSSVACQGCR